jgi:hypothetical protein
MLLSHFSNTLDRVCFQWCQAKKQLLMLAIVVPVLVLSSGCTTALNRVNATFFTPPLELTINQVEPTSQPGVYTVSGRATLPDATRITVSAIRYLQSDVRLSSSPSASPAYVILDRQFAEVNQDNWQTQVNLWEIAADGKFQEAWQVNQANTGIQYEPSSSVTFLATLDPVAQPQDLQTRVEQLDEDVQAALMAFTTDGELYVQASRSFEINLPTGSTAPPAEAAPIRTSPTPVDVNPTPPDATALEGWRQTTAPLSSDRVLR